MKLIFRKFPGIRNHPVVPIHMDIVFLLEGHLELEQILSQMLCLKSEGQWSGRAVLGTMLLQRPFQNWGRTRCPSANRRWKSEVGVGLVTKRRVPYKNWFGCCLQKVTSFVSKVTSNWLSFTRESITQPLPWASFGRTSWLCIFLISPWL